MKNDSPEILRISRKRYQELLSRSQILDYYRKKSAGMDLRLKELEAELLVMKTQAGLTISEKKRHAAKTLDYILNEQEFVETLRKECSDIKPQKSSVPSGEAIDEIIAYIRENIEPNCEYDDNIAYYKNEFGMERKYCPVCEKELEVTSTMSETLLSFHNRKIELYDNTYLGIKCTSCDYTRPNLYTLFPHNQVIEDARIQPELFSVIICRKYYRNISYMNQEMIFRKTDIEITAGMMYFWTEEICKKWLMQLYAYLRSVLVGSKIIYSDNIKVNKAEVRDMPEAEELVVWAYTNGHSEERKIAYYDFCDSSESCHSYELLKEHQGYLCVDKPECYEELLEQERYVCSWSKIRENFIRICDEMIPSAMKGSIAEYMLEMCNQIYVIEGKVREFNDPDFISLGRQRYAKPIIDDMIEVAADSAAFEKDFLLESNTARSLKELTDNEVALREYLKNGELAADNLSAKELLMPFGQPEKRWSVAPAPIQKEYCAAILSILKTAEINNLYPERYLNYYLCHIISDKPVDIERLMPWNAPDECRHSQIKQDIQTDKE